MHRSTNRLSKVLYWCYLAWLLWLPLPIGSNRPVWIGIALAGASLILVAWLAGWALGRIDAPSALRGARWPLAMLGLFLAWQVGQIVLPGFMAVTGAH